MIDKPPMSREGDASASFTVFLSHPPICNIVRCGAASSTWNIPLPICEPAAAHATSELRVEGMIAFARGWALSVPSAKNTSNFVNVPYDRGS